MGHFRRPGLFAAFLLFWLAALGSLRAQGPVDGAVHGVALDLGGQPIRDAEVRLTGVAEHTERRLRTGTDGSFLFAHVTPGSYVVAVKALNLPLAESEPFAVSLGEVAELDAGLRLSSVAVTVEVTAERRASPAPDGVEAVFAGAADGTLPATGDLPATGAMPTAGRAWQDVALMVPGVNPDQDADGLLSVHGLASTENSTLIDGAETTQSYHSVAAGAGSDADPDPDGDADAAERTTGPANGLARGRHAGAAYTFSSAAVREFRVSTLGYSAQTGHAAGAVVATVSRGGTEKLHASARFLLRSQALAARSPQAIATTYQDGLVTSLHVKPHDLRTGFAVTAGGLVPKSVLRLRGLYFFSAVDVERRGFPAVSSPADPLFYSLTATQKALLANRGVTPAATNTVLNYLSSLTGTTPRRADQNIVFGRLDWQTAAHASSRQRGGQPRSGSPGVRG